MDSNAKVCLSALKIKVQLNPIPILILTLAFAVNLQSCNMPAHEIPKCLLSYWTSKMKKKKERL